MGLGLLSFSAISCPAGPEIFLLACISTALESSWQCYKRFLQL